MKATKKEEKVSWLKTFCVLSVIAFICGLLLLFGLAPSFKGTYLQHSIKHVGIFVIVLSMISFFVTQYQYRKIKVHEK